MFTGLIQAVGVVEQVAQAPAGRRLRVRTSWAHRPQPGESITINGCCLTVVGAPELGQGGGQEQTLAFDAVPETLSRTTLGALREGDRVNLERSLRAEDLLGGHLVQGHVDGVGQVVGVEGVEGAPGDGGAGEGRRLRIGAAREVMELVTPKGSIAVDGVSLTVAACDKESFEVALIPETLARTTLSDLQPGDRVNLETDILARTILHWLKVWSK